MTIDQINNMAASVVSIRKILLSAKIDGIASLKDEVSAQLDPIEKYASAEKLDTPASIVVLIRKRLEALTLSNFYITILAIESVLQAIISSVLQLNPIEVRADSRDVDDVKNPPPPPPPPMSDIIALIESIKPNPAKEGELVTFIGSGVGAVGYEWSDGDGILSTKATFTSDKMPPGTNLVSFVVIDDKGLRSKTVQQELEIV